MSRRKSQRGQKSLIKQVTEQLSFKTRPDGAPDAENGIALADKKPLSLETSSIVKCCLSLETSETFKKMFTWLFLSLKLKGRT